MEAHTLSVLGQSIPVEIWILIFRYLPTPLRASLTCKLFRYVTLHLINHHKPALKATRNEDLTHEYKSEEENTYKLQNKDFQLVLEHPNNTPTPTTTESRNVTLIYRAIPVSSPDFPFPRASTPELSVLATKLQNAFSLLPNINSLDLSDRSISSNIYSNFDTVKYLNLSHCRIPDTMVEFFPNNLHVLIMRTNISFTGTGFHHLATKSANLTVLDFSSCWNLRNESLSFLSKFCPSLKILKLSSCKNISDKGIALLKMDKLECLHLCFLTILDRSLESIGKNLPNLKCLRLMKCSKITNEGISHLQNLQLKFLNLKYCSLLRTNTLNFINYNQLISLDLSYLFRLKDISFQNFHLFENLKFLSLLGCEQVTNKTLEFISQNKKIVNLNLGECYQLTNDGLLYIPYSVKILNISYCARITDEGVRTLSENLSLQKLVLCDYNKGISKDVLKELEGRGIEVVVTLVVANAEAKMKSLGLAIPKISTDNLK